MTMVMDPPVTGAGGGVTTASPVSSGPSLPPELIVVARLPETAVPARPFDVLASDHGLGGLAASLRAEGISLAPLFPDVGRRRRDLRGAPPGLLRKAMEGGSVGEAGPGSAAEAAAEAALALFFRVQAPEQRLVGLAERLQERAGVDAAYIVPASEPASALNAMLPSAGVPPQKTPDFEGRQGYLDDAPAGIGARRAWAIAGGTGRDVRIIDVEYEWRFTHEEFIANLGGVVAGASLERLDLRNHGTAVLGELIGGANGFGVTGVCPDANVRAASVYGTNWNAAAAIHAAAKMLRAGDILVVEQHRPGPHFNFQSPQGQMGYIALEWWPQDLMAIQYATARGVIVVAAAGNGAENLDDRLYDKSPAFPLGPFPKWWRNPFRRSKVDSGSILVGAGAPPPGTHKRDWGADRSRLDFSNYGSAVDAQGWGREVTTTGYGDLQGGADEDAWYTDEFAGTSSATPIVAGALACVQGVLRAGGGGTSRRPLTPSEARQLLRTTGSPQQNEVGRPVTQRIGNRPDLAGMLKAVGVQGDSAASAAAASGRGKKAPTPRPKAATKGAGKPVSRLAKTTGPAGPKAPPGTRGKKRRAGLR